MLVVTVKGCFSSSNARWKNMPAMNEVKVPRRYRAHPLAYLSRWKRWFRSSNPPLGLAAKAGREDQPHDREIQRPQVSERAILMRLQIRSWPSGKPGRAERSGDHRAVRRTCAVACPRQQRYSNGAKEHGSSTDAAPGDLPDNQVR